MNELNSSRSFELESLRLKILDAIRVSERFWMIYRKKTFGIATILDLIYKRSYIEILFFTNKDVLELGVPLLKIRTPPDTQFDFNEVLVDPDFDEDGLISPKKIIKRVNKLIEKEIKYHLAILDKEILLIDKNFENKPIENNPYFRKIRIYLPKAILKLKINLENYPYIPQLSEKNQIIIEKYIKTYRHRLKEILREKVRGEIRQKPEKVKIIRENILINTNILKNWNIKKPPHIFEVIESLFNLEEGSQHLTFNNVSIANEIEDIFFKIHRGQSIGIYHDMGLTNQTIENSPIIKLFRIITGTNSNFSGEIKIFGKEIQSQIKNKEEGIFIVSSAIDPKMDNMTIKNASTHNIKIKPKWKIRKRILVSSSKSMGLLSKIDEIISLPPKYKRRKSFIDSALEVVGLLNRKNEKISNLTSIERLLFSISRTLLKSPKILMVSVPDEELGQIETEQFNKYMQRIKKKFHVILIIHGQKEIISECDQILTIRDKKAEIDSIKNFITKMPQEGEIITIELSDPDESALRKMFEIESAIFITERKNEKFKIFSKENPNNVIIKLMEAIGPYIYNFKRYKASLTDYLEFLEIN
ncbi:MAG: hypothetical protein ACFFAN_05875 [Promethearchaeota archaeon]